MTLTLGRRWRVESKKKQVLDKRLKSVYRFDNKELTGSCCGRSSAVERQLPKLNVEGSSPFARFVGKQVFKVPALFSSRSSH